MKSLAITIATGALALTCAATANAAPSGGTDVNDVVMQLQESGNTVIVNRTGAGPASQCSVTGVRPGQTYSRYDSGYPGAGNDPMRQVTDMTVFVDVKCSM